MAKAKPISGLRAEDSFSLAAAKVVAVRTGELAEHSRGVLDTTDIEAVHRMRVTTRRLRAALEVFAPCFPAKRHRRALKDVKRLADALGERRDRDVTIASLSQFAEAVAAADRPGVNSLIDRLREEQAEANEALAPYVADEWLGALGARLADLVESAREGASDGDGADPQAVQVDRIAPPLTPAPVPLGTGNGAASG